MLRITVRERASEQRWILQGRLTKECIDELVSWKRCVYEQEIPPIDSHLFERNTRCPSFQSFCVSQAFPPGLSEQKVRVSDRTTGFAAGQASGRWL